MTKKIKFGKSTALMSLLVSLFLFSVSAQADLRDEVILFHTDYLGSAVAAYDENGDLCWEEDYTPYGDKTIEEDSFNRVGCGIVAEERGYTGHAGDYSSDLVYMQQRYYDPSIGRFLSLDPMPVNPNDTRTINRYSYAANSPYKYTDPTGELFFLAPVAVFLAKEVAAEIASQATNGATDFLSLRRVATKGIKYVSKKLARNNNCSFDGSTEVLTHTGYRAIADIEDSELVLSRDEITGALSWEAVLNTLSNTYDETVSITLEDVNSGQRQTIISNRIHPFFVQREGAVNLYKVGSRSAPLSTEGLSYRGSISNGHWIDAALLESGDRLLNDDGSWSTVTSVDIESAEIVAYNLDVANSDTFFVRGAGGNSDKFVWVHNTCIPDVPKGGDDFVDGYRAVSKAEADDIAKHGLRPNPNGRSMEDKWFSESREGAEKFKQNYSDLDDVVEVRVPRAVYDRSHRVPNIDNTGPGFCVSCNDLGTIQVK